MAIRLHGIFEEQIEPTVSDKKMAVGPLLKKTRLAKGLRLPEIAKELCIRKIYLQALENENREELPDACYVLGFVRSYATHLGLDPQEMVERFKDEFYADFEEEDHDLHFPINEPTSRIPNAWMMGMSLIIAVLVYSAWTYSQPSDTIEAVSQVDEVTEEAVVQPEQTAAAVVEEEITPAEEVVAAEVPAPVEEESVAPIQIATVETVQQQPALPKGVVAIRAVRETWVQVGDGERLPLISKVMRPGEVFRVPAESADMKLLTGNAGGLEILVDGTPVPAIGSYGKILRNVKLDASLLTQGQAVVN